MLFKLFFGRARIAERRPTRPRVIDNIDLKKLPSTLTAQSHRVALDL